MSRYQKCNTNLDFTEASDSECQWHQPGHMQVCNSLQTDNHASTPPLSFVQARWPFCQPTNSVKALKANLLDKQMHQNYCLKSSRKAYQAFKCDILQKTIQKTQVPVKQTKAKVTFSYLWIGISNDVFCHGHDHEIGDPDCDCVTASAHGGSHAELK